MAAFTLAEAQAMVAAYKAAEIAVLAGQGYSIGTRRLERADLSEIRKGRAEWEAKVSALQNGGTGGVRVRGLSLG